MEPFFRIMTFLLILGAFTRAQSANSMLPPCALKCMAKALADSSCQATDLACICTNAEFNFQFSACIQPSCTIKESLTTMNISAMNCNKPIRDSGNAIPVVGITGGAIALVSVAMRLYARFNVLAGQLGLDDWIIIATMIFIIPASVLSYFLKASGLGRDVWTLSFNKITQTLHIFYVEELLYLFCITLTKISIVFFYLRIFPGRKFKMVSYGIIAITACFGTAFIIAHIFTCIPVNLSWKRWDGEHRGRCNNSNAQVWANAVINILLDISILLLPMPMLVKLSLSINKKIGVCLMFSVGIFATIVSILRLRTLVKVGNSHNFTRDNVPAALWSLIEVDVGVICACMPGIRGLLSSALPSVFSSVNRTESLKASGSRRVPQYRNSVPFKRQNADSHFVELDDIESISSRMNIRQHAH